MWPESDVFDLGDMWNVQCCRGPGMWLRITALIMYHPILNSTVNLTNSVNKSKHEIKTHIWSNHAVLSLLLQALLSWLVFHWTQALHSPSAMLYQVRYRASLPCQNSHTYGAGSKYITLLITMVKVFLGDNVVQNLVVCVCSLLQCSFQLECICTILEFFKKYIEPFPMSPCIKQYTKHPAIYFEAWWLMMRHTF